MSTIELSQKVQELRELRRMADELSAEIEAAQDAIKAHMTALSVDTLTGTDYRITWKSVTSSRFDSKSFKADHADLYSAYSKPSTSRRFILA